MSLLGSHPGPVRVRMEQPEGSFERGDCLLLGRLLGSSEQDSPQ